MIKESCYLTGREAQLTNSTKTGSFRSYVDLMTTLLEEIFAVEALPRNFKISRKFIFVDATIPQISRELIFS